MTPRAARSLSPASTQPGDMPTSLHPRTISDSGLTIPRPRLPIVFRALVLSAALQLLQLRRIEADDRVDLKFLYYGEENNRVTTWGPSFIVQKDLSSRFQLKIEGVYDVISGASPTGAPAPSQIRLAPGTNSSNFTLVSGPSGRTTGATVAGPTTGARPSGPPGLVSNDTTLPTQTFWDNRLALDAELRFREGDYLFTGQIAFSIENDYTSLGATLKAAREFNQKNTVVSAGIAYIHDDVDVFRSYSSEEKESVQLLLGVTQLLDPKTVLNVNFVAGFAEGYLSDPYKSALVNNTLLPDKRPESKSQQILYTSLTRSVDRLNGSVEASYRFYRDTFGVSGHTTSLAWYQNIGPSVVLRPSVRYHQQDAADFYAVQFYGRPDNYSADYRLSNSAALSYGLKAIWTPRERWSADIGYERYKMWGRDGVTSPQAYPTANIVTAGLHFFF